MYRVYYTDPETETTASYTDAESLEEALAACDQYRNQGMLYVVMVNDYHNMVGSPGATVAEPVFVPPGVQN